MVDFQVIPAEDEHCRAIGGRMRASDALEVWRSSGKSPTEALLHSMHNSTASTVLVNGRPEIMFGVGDLNVLAGVGAVWLLGTDVIRDNWRWFLRETARGRDGLFKRHEVLRNVVDQENVASIRWLQWLGAKFLGEIDVHGHPFVLFEMRRRGNV